MSTITRDHYELHLNVLRETIRGLCIAHGDRVPKSYLHSLLEPTTESKLLSHMEFLRSNKTRDEWLLDQAARQPSLPGEEMPRQVAVPSAPIIPEDPVETEPDMGYTR